METVSDFSDVGTDHLVQPTRRLRVNLGGQWFTMPRGFDDQSNDTMEVAGTGLTLRLGRNACVEMTVVKNG